MSPHRELSGVCLECIREANTYMVELINYPGLNHPKERQLALLKNEYDAILLVYDVGNRQSFEAAQALYNDIPSRNRRRASMSRSRPGWRGGGNVNGSNNSHASPSSSSSSSSSSRQGRNGPVVALVGNKSDFDEDYVSIELGLDGPIMEKEMEIQVAEVDERNLVHPLFRESRVYDDPPFSPRSFSYGARDLMAEARRSVVSADMPYSRTSVLSRQRSIQTAPVGRERPLPRLLRQASKNDVVEQWLETGSPTVEDTPVVDEIENETQIGSNDSESTTAAKRQVSRLEGEVMAQRLQLLVPFFETSAKTGDNVEELFESVIRLALREKGVDVDAEANTNARLGKNCKQRHGLKRLETRRSPGQDGVSPTSTLASSEGISPIQIKITNSNNSVSIEDFLLNPPPAVSQRDDERSGRHKTLEEGVPTQKRVRRESVMRRVKSLFFKKPVTLAVTDISA
jgi:hypothetical protein